MDNSGNSPVTVTSENNITSNTNNTNIPPNNDVRLTIDTSSVPGEIQTINTTEGPIRDDVSTYSTDYPVLPPVQQRISLFQPVSSDEYSERSTLDSRQSVQQPLPHSAVRPSDNSFTGTMTPSSITKVNTNTHNQANSNVKFNIFKNEFIAIRSNNIHVLKESKECKRLLDLKYNDLLFMINNIQTSVIFTSTISGFLQATKLQFEISNTVVSVVSITIATYISLVLSISKYYALDELKERIQLLREKYSLLLNEIDYNMDKLGPWSMRRIWKYEDPYKKYEEWRISRDDVNNRYNEIVNTKKELVTEYECIMDTKSRNHYHIQNKRLNLENKQKIYEWEKKEVDLETIIAKDKKDVQEKARLQQLDIRRGSVMLATEDLDNWTFEADEWSSV